MIIYFCIFCLLIYLTKRCFIILAMLQKIFFVKALILTEYLYLKINLTIKKASKNIIVK